MSNSKEHLRLQPDFVKRAQLITGKPIEECLMEYSSFYKTLIPDWDFNPNNPVWIDFVNEFKNTNDLKALIDRLCQSEEPMEVREKYYGCFSYKYVEDQKTVYLHFKNTDEPEGVLSKVRIEARKEELKEMFSDIKEKHPEAEKVSGFSWLYNIYAYKRLFPLEYTENPAPIHGWFKTMAIWGQFLDRNLRLKEDISTQFGSCIQSKNTIEELEGCFPYKILQPKCDIAYFYKFVDII